MPKYALLVAELKELVDTLPVGSAVPSERVLAESAGVSRMTARRALDVLEQDGFLQRIVGKGSFVSRPAVSLPLRLTSFSEDMRARGMQPSARVLEQTMITAGDALAEYFGVARTEKILRLVRLRLADGQPFAIERSHLRALVMPGIERLDFTHESLYAAIERDYGIRFDAGRQSIRAGNALRADAEVLGIETGAAVLELVRTSVARGIVIERTTSIYPGDRFELSAAIAPVSAVDEASGSAIRARRDRQ